MISKDQSKTRPDMLEIQSHAKWTFFPLKEATTRGFSVRLSHYPRTTANRARRTTPHVDNLPRYSFDVYEPRTSRVLWCDGSSCTLSGCLLQQPTTVAAKQSFIVLVDMFAVFVGCYLHHCRLHFSLQRYWKDVSAHMYRKFFSIHCVVHCWMWYTHDIIFTELFDEVQSPHHLLIEYSIRRMVSEKSLFSSIGHHLHPQMS